MTYDLRGIEGTDMALISLAIELRIADCEADKDAEGAGRWRALLLRITQKARYSDR